MQQYIHFFRFFSFFNVASCDHIHLCVIITQYIHSHTHQHTHTQRCAHGLSFVSYDARRYIRLLLQRRRGRRRRRIQCKQQSQNHTMCIHENNLYSLPFFSLVLSIDSFSAFTARFPHIFFYSAVGGTYLASESPRHSSSTLFDSIVARVYHFFLLYYFGVFAKSLCVAVAMFIAACRIHFSCRLIHVRAWSRFMTAVLFASINRNPLHSAHRSSYVHGLYGTQ